MINIEIEKTSTLEYISLDITDIIKYTIIVTNNGDEVVNTLKVINIEAIGEEMVPSTVLINNEPAGNYLCPDNTIIIPTLAPTNNIIITFDAKVDRENPPAEIISEAKVDFFDIYGNYYSEISNKCIVEVVKLNVVMEKKSDKVTANVGENIGYTVFIKNNSNIQLLEVTFFDPWPPELDIYNDCFLVNGEETYKNLEELAQGIFLNRIEPGESVIITFYGTVLYKPTCSIVSNRAYINYEYVVSDPKLANRFIKGTIYSNYSDVRING